MWREAWVEDDCVVVKCALDEIERYHLRDLKADVATANKGLKQARIRQLEADERSRKKAEEEQKKRDAILDRLKFD